MTALKMTVDEALALADQWCAGLTMDADSKGWGAILLVLAEEVRRLREKENSADMCLEAVHSARQCLSDHFGGNLAFLDDDLIRGVVKMHEELEAVYDLLPSHYYMDPPDGGDVPLLEQMRRMAEDARRYRWLTGNCLHSFSMTQDEPAEHTLVFEWRQSDLSEAGWSIHDAIDAAIAEWEAG